MGMTKAEKQEALAKLRAEVLEPAVQVAWRAGKEVQKLAAQYGYKQLVQDEFILVYDGDNELVGKYARRIEELYPLLRAELARQTSIAYLKSCLKSPAQIVPWELTSWQIVEQQLELEQEHELAIKRAELRQQAYELRQQANELLQKANRLTSQADAL